MALQVFRKIQIGKETTRGTGVAAAKKLIGTLTMSPQITRHRPKDDDGSLAEFRRSVDLSQRASLRYEGDVTYEQLVDFLLMAIKGGITPTQPGTGEARLWTFTPNLTSRNNQDSYTWEYGDDTQELESAFVMVSSLELSFAANEIVSLRAELFGRLASKATFTAGLSDPTVNEVVANKARVYIDSAWANLGTTQKSDLVVGGTIRLNTGLVPIWKANGSLDYADFSEQRRHLSVRLDMAVNSSFFTEYDAWAARTTRALRLQFDGPAFSAPDNGLARFLRIDLTGQYTNESVDLFGERDGENIVQMELGSHKDSSGNEFSIAVQNNVASV